jgi:GTP-binding protein
MGIYRKRFKLDGTPVRIEFRSDENPFAGKRNPLTPRQERSKKKAAHRAHKGKKKRGS